MNRNAPNRRLAGILKKRPDLAAGLSVACLGILVFITLSGCSKNPAELQKEFQAKGLQYLQSGKSSEAIIEFQNLVKVKPKYAMGHYWLGEAYRRNGWVMDAVLQFRQAEELDPLLLPPYLALAHYGVNTGQWVAATKQIDTALKIDPNNLEALTLKSRIALIRNDLDQAQAVIKKVLGRKSDYAPAWVVMGDIRRVQNRLDEAEGFYRKTLSMDDQNTHAWIGLGSVEEGKKNIQAAIEDFRRAVASRPQSIQANIVLANALAGQGHVHQAVAQLDTLSAKHVDIRVPVKIAEYETLLGENQKAIALLQPMADQKTQIADVYYVLALAYQQAGHPRNALDALNHLSEVHFSTPLYFIGAAKIALSLGQPQEALSFLKSVKSSGDRSPAYWDIQVRSKMALGQREEAIHDIRRALVSYPNDPGLEILEADVFVAGKKPKDAISVLGRVLSKDPNNIPAILRKANLLTALNGPHAGLAFIRDEVGKHPENDTLESAYVLAVSRGKDVNQAVSLANDYLKAHPQAFAVRRVLAAFDVDTHKEGDALDQLKALLARNPDDLSALSAMALLDLRLRNFSDAESIFRKEISISPANPGYQVGLGESLVGENRIAEAREAFKSALSRDPGQKGALLGLARIEVFSGKAPNAMSHLQPLLKANLPPRTKSEILWLWGIANMNVGNNDEAGRALKQSVSLASNNPLNHSSLGDYWESQSEWKKAASEYIKSLALDPKNEIVALKKNWALFQAKSTPQTDQNAVQIRDRALEYLGKHPGNEVAAMIAAQGDLFLKNPDAAIGVFDQILARNPGSSSAQMGKARILFVQRHFKEAKDALSRFVSDHPNDPDANLLMASIDEKLGNIGDEAAHLEIYNHAHPDQIGPALTLSAANLVLHKYSEAQSLTQSVLQSHPGLPLAIYYEAQAKMGLSDYRGALLTASKAVRNQKQPAPFYALMGEAELHLGENDAAIRDMKEAIRLAPQDPMTLNNLAYLLSGNPANLPEALKYSKEALSISKQPSIEDTVGYILFRMGNYKEADGYFQSAFDAHFRDPEFLYHMGMNDWRLGRNGVARDRLKRAMLSGNLSPEEVKNSKAVLKAIQSQRM